MKARGWRQVELVGRSGLTKQVVSRLLDPDTELRRMIDDKTVRGLAQAFQLPEQLVRAKADEAIRGPGALELIVTPAEPSNDELLQILRKRLGIDVSTDPPGDTGGLVHHSSNPATSPNTETAAASVAGVNDGGGVSGETVTPGELRHPRRQSRGSDSTDEPSRTSAHV